MKHSRFIVGDQENSSFARPRRPAGAAQNLTPMPRCEFPADVLISCIAIRETGTPDCFAEPVIGRRLAPTRWPHPPYVGALAPLKRVAIRAFASWRANLPKRGMVQVHVRRYRNQGSMSLHLRAAAISESCAPCWAQGNRNEENTCCRTDRRVVYFDRSKSSRSCWRCCAGRGLGGGRLGTCGRGGGCVHWIYRRALDRAFLGTGAVRIAISGAAYCTIQPWKPRDWHPRAGGRQGKFAPGCQISRDASREEGRAACSGI
jgi:hypothetical protein